MHENPLCIRREGQRKRLAVVQRLDRHIMQIRCIDHIAALFLLNADRIGIFAGNMQLIVARRVLVISDHHELVLHILTTE